MKYLENTEGLIGDFLGTIPVMQALAKKTPLLVKYHPEAAQVIGLIPKSYGIVWIKELPAIESDRWFKRLNIQQAFQLAWDQGLYMSQTYFPQVGLPIPYPEPAADLTFPDMEVPLADYVLAPFSRSLPDNEKWPQQEWNNLVKLLPDKKFVVIGSSANDPNFITGPNVQNMYGSPLAEVCNLMLKSKGGLISVVSGPSHLAFHIGAKNILLTNQQSAWGNNPRAVQVRDTLSTLKAEKLVKILL